MLTIQPRFHDAGISVRPVCPEEIPERKSDKLIFCKSVRRSKV
jgi:hypothetical protein